MMQFGHILSRSKSLIALGCGAFFAITLVGASALAAGGGGHSGELHVNWWTWDDHAPPVGWFIVDFVIFVGLLVYFMKKPLQTTFAKRHTDVRTAIDNATKAFDQAEAEHSDYQNKLAGADKESTDIVGASKADGALERDSLIDAAQKYANRLEGDSASIIDNELMRARKRLQAEASREALAKAESLLRAGVTADDHTRLIDSAITELAAGSGSTADNGSAGAGQQQVAGGAR